MTGAKNSKNNLTERLAFLLGIPLKVDLLQKAPYQALLSKGESTSMQLGTERIWYLPESVRNSYRANSPTEAIMI